MLAKRIQKELVLFRNDPPPQCEAEPDEKDCRKWKARIGGPQGTPYEGGLFELSVVIPDEYPFKGLLTKEPIRNIKAPTIKFVTKIYHCNISKKGNICLDTLKDCWNPSLTLSKVLLSIVRYVKPYFEMKNGVVFYLSQILPIHWNQRLPKNS